VGGWVVGLVIRNSAASPSARIAGRDICRSPSSEPALSHSYQSRQQNVQLFTTRRYQRSGHSPREWRDWYYRVFGIILLLVIIFVVESTTFRNTVIGSIAQVRSLWTSGYDVIFVITDPSTANCQLAQTTIFGGAGGGGSGDGRPYCEFWLQECDR